MRINVTSVFVEDQVAALRFYTEVLGFVRCSTPRERRG
jgi:catechol 2,3-dioxygenase-like lactoylglutathione lyase family enzyme